MACESVRCHDGSIPDYVRNETYCKALSCTYGGVSYPKIMFLDKYVTCYGSEDPTPACTAKAGCCN